MSDFADKLSALCSRELAAARMDPDRFGVMLERLTASLAFTVAMGGQGDPSRISNLLEGVTQHLFSEAAEKAPFARMMNP